AAPCSRGPMQAPRSTRELRKSEEAGSSVDEGRSVRRSTGAGEIRTLRHVDYNEGAGRIGSLHGRLDHAVQAERIAQAVGRAFRIIARRIGSYDEAVQSRRFVHIGFNSKHYIFVRHLGAERLTF